MAEDSHDRSNENGELERTSVEQTLFVEQETHNLLHSRQSDDRSLTDVTDVTDSGDSDEHDAQGPTDLYQYLVAHGREDSMELPEGVSLTDDSESVDSEEGETVFGHAF